MECHLKKILTTISFCLISATIDVKKSIYDLAINRYDTQIALIENQGMFNSVQESVVRVYDVGRRRDDEDEQVRKPTFFSEDFRKRSESESLPDIEINMTGILDYISYLINSIPA